jgi:hypothetical protein
MDSHDSGLRLAKAHLAAPFRAAPLPLCLTHRDTPPAVRWPPPSRRAVGPKPGVHDSSRLLCGVTFASPVRDLTITVITVVHPPQRGTKHFISHLLPPSSRWDLPVILACDVLGTNRRFSPRKVTGLPQITTA